MKEIQTLVSLSLENLDGGFDSMNNKQPQTSLYGFEVRVPDKRRVEPEGRKTYNIQQLWQRTHEIIALTLLGMKEVEVAKSLNIHPQTVSNTINSDLGRKKLSEMREERDKDFTKVAEETAKLFPIAMKTYERILEGEEKSKLQKETADTIVMDIGGFRAPTKVQGEHVHAYLDRDAIEEFKKRGIEAARASGMLVEEIPEAETINEGEGNEKTV
jgi:DNA-binding CsgD family transcriptional regulator